MSLVSTITQTCLSITVQKKRKEKKTWRWAIFNQPLKKCSCHGHR